MTGFDWFAWWAGALLLLSARHLHPPYSPYRPACLSFAAGNFLSMSAITPLTRHSAELFHTVFSNLDLCFAIAFALLAGRRRYWLMTASAVSLAGWAYGRAALMEARLPDAMLAVRPDFFHHHGADAYLLCNFPIILCLTVGPWLSRQRSRRAALPVPGAPLQP